MALAHDYELEQRTRSCMGIRITEVCLIHTSTLYESISEIFNPWVLK